MGRKWKPMEDLSTPEERRWLNRLEKVRNDMAPIKITDRRHGIHFTRDRPPARGGRGAYLINLAWVKKEVLRLERQRRRERQQDIQNHVGAYI
jgi:hypothetical protein